LEAKIKIGPHKGDHVAIKEVDLEELADKSLDNLCVNLFFKNTLARNYNYDFNTARVPNKNLYNLHFRA
jgi:hypothetical protein